MNWTCTVTTAPRPAKTINKTLASFKKTGWPDPTIVEENGSGIITTWIRALKIMLQTNADYMVAFQDDVTFCTNLRDFVESAPLFEQDIVSPYAPYYINSEPGWQITRQFITAQVYIFSRRTCMEIVESYTILGLAEPNDKKNLTKPEGFLFYSENGVAQQWDNLTKLYRINRFNPPFYSQRWNIYPKTQYLDRHLWYWSLRNNRRFWIHTPSLAQHLCESSALGDPDGSRSQHNYVSEDFDARKLIR